MLDRDVVKEFLDCQLEDMELEIHDYYEWLKDNFKSFFNHGNPDWEWIRGRIEYLGKDHWGGKL